MCAAAVTMCASCGCCRRLAPSPSAWPRPSAPSAASSSATTPSSASSRGRCRRWSSPTRTQGRAAAGPCAECRWPASRRGSSGCSGSSSRCRWRTSPPPWSSPRTPCSASAPGASTRATMQRKAPTPSRACGCAPPQPTIRTPNTGTTRLRSCSRQRDRRPPLGLAAASWRRRPPPPPRVPRSPATSRSTGGAPATPPSTARPSSTSTATTRPRTGASRASGS
mmetsp:Transcript_30573/g.72771  ORF Transcript_30573/g.72771 Transcript_30573/m.72771 type:complete len:223 (-) Transcript_30573:969-1637(-)